MRAVACALLAAVALVACAPATAGSGGARASGRFDHSADRVIVPRMARINGVAVTQRFAFITSEDGLATFDRLIGSWMPPVGEPEPGPPRRILGVAAHPLDDAAWIIEDGAVVRFEPTLGWSMRAMVVGRIEAVAFDRRDPQQGIYVRSLGQWSRISPAGFRTPVPASELPPPDARISPPTLEELMNRHPALRGYARLLTRDDDMRSWEPSAGAEVPEGGEFWLGTWGYGAFRVEPEFLRSVHEPYGLVDRGVGAIAHAADGVWIAGTSVGAAARDAADALVFASLDLRDWEWRGTGAADALDGARALVVRGRRAWVATDRGAVRMELTGATRAQRVSALHGLPSDEVFALAARLDGVWIGTARGMTFIPEDWDGAAPAATPRAEGPVLLAGTAVRALLPVGDTLWIGAEPGLLLLAPGASVPDRVGSAGADARLRRPVRALAHHDSVVAVLTADDLLLVHALDGRVLATPAAASVRAVGTPSVVRMDARTLWIGGSSGVLVVDRATGTSRRLGVPGDLPGRVRDLAIGELFAWIATDEGLVRLRREPGGLPR